jgi:protein-disulfide isomerase
MSRSVSPQKRSGEMSKKEAIKIQRKREQRRKQLIPIVLISVAAVVLVVLLVLPSLLPKQVNSRPLENGTNMGNPNAAVVVEEFADFQCPSCALFFNDYEPNIVTKYVSTGKIYFKFIPFSFIGPESVAAAEAALCANDQGKFWQYHDTLYTNQQGENQGWFSTARLVDFAQSLNLDTTQFKTCLDTEKYKQQVQDDLDYGKQKGIDRTPSFLVNGRLVYADTITAVIESTLNSLATPGATNTSTP